MHGNAAAEWEPVPWNVPQIQAAEQSEGFRKRAGATIAWTKVPLLAFPPEGVFGKPRDWFISNEIAYTSLHDGEELILIQRFWHGFPDPPEWGLASRPIGRSDLEWSTWGAFSRPPDGWLLNGCK
jgi:hypothetical protein